MSDQKAMIRRRQLGQSNPLRTRERQRRLKGGG